MFGMENKGEHQKKKFMFDLERDIHEHPKRCKELIDKAEKRIQAIKKVLREGTQESEFDKWGVLLHGYTAFQKVMKKASK